MLFKKGESRAFFSSPSMVLVDRDMLMMLVMTGRSSSVH